jgi:hypothetical protein
MIPIQDSVKRDCMVDIREGILHLFSRFDIWFRTPASMRENKKYPQCRISWVVKLHLVKRGCESYLNSNWHLPVAVVFTR